MSIALASPAQDAIEPYGQAGNLARVPLIEMFCNDGKYWSMPFQQSQRVYAEHTMGNRYVDYKYAPKGEGSASPLIEYIIDFEEMEQHRLPHENHSGRPIRIVWVDTFLAKNFSDSLLLASAVQPGMDTQVPIVEAAFKNDMWWSMPPDLSTMIYDHYKMGMQGACYVWAWSDGREGTWTNAGQSTNLNRYEIDFEKMVQKNIDTGGFRTIRIVWTAPTVQC